MVATGRKAPDFIAPGVVGGDGRMVELFAEVRAHEAVVLLFFPADFVPACTAELCAVRDAWDDPRLAVFGLSGDSLFSHAAYAERYELWFPLVTDFHGAVAETYDLLAEEWEGHARIPRRATVVIDGDWEVAFRETADPLDTPTPAPVENATDTLRDIGVDLPRPAVDYSGV